MEALKWIQELEVTKDDVECDSLLTVQAIKRESIN